MKARNALSYGLLTLGAVGLVAAAILGLSIPPLAAASLALALMFIGGGWLAMKPEPGSTSGRPMQLFLGRLLLSAGVLFAVLCGACTLFWWGVYIPPTLTHSVPPRRVLQPVGILGAIMLPLFIGGIPFLVGLGVGAFGRRLIRSYQRKREL